MRIFYIGFWVVIFSLFCDTSHAQVLPGSGLNEPKVKYQPPKEIPKPTREERLSEVLPVIHGIYNNANRYTSRSSGYGDDRTITYLENARSPAEEAITLQNLEDIAELIDFLNSREANSQLYPDGPALPRPSRAGFATLWPDDINFVMGPGLRGCTAFCRQLLLESEFTSVTVLETEILEEEPVPQPVRATRYRIDERACETPRDGHRMRDGDDETINLPNHSSPSAIPPLGLCFTYEAVDVPENGAFVYFNHASPFWPDEFERTHTRVEHVPDPRRAMERVIHPKAFEGLETEFYLNFIKHIAYEFRAPGLETKTVLAFESACVRPVLPIHEESLNLLIASHLPAEDFLGFRFSKSLFVSPHKGLCTGNRREGEPRLPMAAGKHAELNIEDLVPFSELVQGVKDSLETYKKTEHHLDYGEMSSILRRINMEGISQTQIDALVPVYESMFDNHVTAHLALKDLQKLPEGSLAGHIKSLNRIRDKIAKNAGCKTVGCDGRYFRVYRSSPSVRIHQSRRGGGHWVPKSDEDKWIQLAGGGASIYAAAGPKALKHLEAAHKTGLGGGVYALGCIGASSEMLEELALQTVGSHNQIYPQPTIRHFLSIRHSPRSEQYKQAFLKQKRVKSFYNSHIRAVLAWDNKTSLCRYRNEI